MTRARLAAISAADLDRVGAFLHQHLNSRISGEQWAAAAKVPWSVNAPNHGFMLVDGSDVVGVYLAFYSDRVVEARVERFCNLGAWCVLPSHRLKSIVLLQALLGQDGYHFTDLSPSGNTVPVNRRLKFDRLDTTTVLLLNLPWPSWRETYRITSESTSIEGMLTDSLLQIYRDHQGARAVYHVAIAEGEEQCYVMFRRDRRKGLPLFATVLFVSNTNLFRKAAKAFCRHLLFSHGVVMTLVELRVSGGRPAGSILLHSSRPKMFRSDSLRSSQIDYLYSELVCVAW